MKICSKCGVEYPKASFTKDKNRVDGLDPWCRTCKRDSKDKGKERNALTSKLWKAKNADAVKENWKNWYSLNKGARKQYQATEEYKAVHRKAEAKRRESHRERCRTQRKRYREAHPDKHYASYVAWAKKNPDRLSALRRAAEITRRDKKRSAGERVSADFVERVYRKFDHKCFNCGSASRLSVDHHYPLSLGYALVESNAVVLCVLCNSRKKAKLPEQFYSDEQISELSSKYGVMKQSDDIVRATTVAKVRENVVFGSPSEERQVACIYLCG